MNALKKLITYFIWTILALIIGVGYMRVVLGPNNTSTEGVGYLFTMYYNWSLFHVGAIIGLIVAVLFILLDVFYLKKKLKNNVKGTSIRCVLLFITTVFIGIIHYVLEKIIDVI